MASALFEGAASGPLIHLAIKMDPRYNETWAAMVAREYLYLGGMLSSALVMFEVHFGLLVLVGYMVVDAQEIIEKAHLGGMDHVKHALYLFTDFVDVFVRILIIMLCATTDILLLISLFTIIPEGISERKELLEVLGLGYNNCSGPLSPKLGNNLSPKVFNFWSFSLLHLRKSSAMVETKDVGMKIAEARLPLLMNLIFSSVIPAWTSSAAPTLDEQKHDQCVRLVELSLEHNKLDRPLFDFRAMTELLIPRSFGNPFEFLPEILPLPKLEHLSLANIKIVADENLRSVNMQIEVSMNA
ncbi:Bax inhibitor 1-related protein [Corchorus olitorius]|uniref:Bax inhibitor 1-related protein n=1 Tax=Corchorus olitorius TaxID=93759 RepID=A0A1R3J9I1_9ROSI|nr:Bax inhibitor 1-related protein [Corchorus olitorius]